MLKAIGHNLPRYHEKRDTSRPQMLAAQDEWLALLSYVYADIVRFCLELYSIFSKNSKGMFYYVLVFLSVVVGPSSSGGANTCVLLMRVTPGSL